MFATFNVADLSLFDASDDLRLNSSKERGNNEKDGGKTSKDPLHVGYGPIIGSRA